MKSIDTILNAIVEEGFAAIIYFIPISMVVLSIFKLYGSSLILGFLTSLIITAVLFVVRVYVRLKGKTLAEKNLKESVLVGAIISATFLMYTVIYSAITSSNFVPFAFAFVTYILWKYYKNLEGTVSIKRVLKMCIFISIQFLIYHSVPFTH